MFLKRRPAHSWKNKNRGYDLARYAVLIIFKITESEFKIMQSVI